MPWLEIVFPRVAGDVERLGTALEASGALAISSEDAADQPILEPAPGATPLWARYGCGSGILAIAALKLGAARATAIDIDPQAREAARANGRRNGVRRALTVAEALPGPFRCDVLLANIIASVLVELAERLAGAIAPRGRLVLAGILDHEAGVVADAYRTWFDMDAAHRCGEWTRLDGIRRD